MAELFLKDPGATTDYRVEWENALLPDVAITACTWGVWPVHPGGVEVSGSSVDGTDTVVRLSGGEAGRIYHVTGHAEMSDGTTDERSLTVRVEER